MRDPVTSAGFPPIANRDARVLILGSLPGRASLQAQQYYAHARNGFWTIMRELAGAEGTYAERCAALAANGIAVWDVLASSVRPGSMDANIDLASAVANDFDDFFRCHPELRLVCFNGRKAEQLYRRFVQLAAGRERHTFATLPSTSPAYAAMSISEKTRVWRGIIGPELEKGK